MSRGITAGMATAVSTGVIRPILLVDLDFQSGALRMWSGSGNLSWDSKTWTGAGTLLGLSKVGETADIKAAGTSVSISGIPSADLALVLGETYRNRAATIYLGCVKSSDCSVVADPVILYKGKMDIPTIDEGPETSVININIESKLIALESPKNRKWTDQAQKAIDATDKGLEYVARLSNIPLYFGK